MGIGTTFASFTNYGNFPVHKGRLNNLARDEVMLLGGAFSIRADIRSGPLALSVLQSQTCQYFQPCVRHIHYWRQLQSLIYITNNVRVKVLQQDPTIRAYSDEHIPYLIVSLSFVFTLIFCPGLLISLYPTILYGKLSSQCLSGRKQLVVIKIFVETVNCGFKDGLNGIHNYRMIPGVLILLGLTYAILLSFFLFEKL